MNASKTPALRKPFAEMNASKTKDNISMTGFTERCKKAFIKKYPNSATARAKDRYKEGRKSAIKEVLEIIDKQMKELETMKINTAQSRSEELFVLKAKLKELGGTK
jgi:hypothetical protein